MAKPQQHTHGTGSDRRLTAWTIAMDVAENVFRLTGSFPRDERFGLTAQLRRAAVSVPSNLAEGNERLGQAEKRHFASVARGSVGEVETQLELSVRLGYVPDDAAQVLFDQLDHLGRLITRLRKSFETE